MNVYIRVHVCIRSMDKQTHVLWHPINIDMSNSIMYFPWVYLPTKLSEMLNFDNLSIMLQNIVYGTCDSTTVRYTPVHYWLVLDTNINGILEKLIPEIQPRMSTSPANRSGKIEVPLLWKLAPSVFTFFKVFYFLAKITSNLLYCLYFHVTLLASHIQVYKAKLMVGVPSLTHIPIDI